MKAKKMRRIEVLFHDIPAGVLEEVEYLKRYRFSYYPDYAGPPVSLTMPVEDRVFDYDRFPPFLEGLLPEGPQLEALLRIGKIDRNDMLSQIIVVGEDLVGAATVRKIR